MEKKQYDLVRKNRADLRALLRGLVSAYLLYLAWNLVFHSADPTFPPAARILGGILFAGGAAAFE